MAISQTARVAELQVDWKVIWGILQRICTLRRFIMIPFPLTRHMRNYNATLIESADPVLKDVLEDHVRPSLCVKLSIHEWSEGSQVTYHVTLF